MIISAALLLSVVSIEAPRACTAASDSIPVKEWKVPWEKTRPRDPSVDKDGRVWFVGQTGHYIGVLDPKSGDIKKYDLEEGNNPHSQIIDKDGNVWYSGNTSGHIGRLDPKTGEIKKYPIPDPSIKDPHTLIFDKNGDIWFTAQNSGAVGRFSPKTGKYDVVKTASGAKPYGIVLDSNGRPYFDEFGTNKIGTIDPKTLEIKEYPLPNERARPRRIAMTSDGIVWYGDYSRGMLGRLDPKTGQVTEYPLPEGPNAMPYGLTSDDKDRIWIADISSQATSQVRIVSFDPKDCNFFSGTTLPGTPNTVRYMIFHKATRELWFGSDANTIGRIKVP